MRKDEIRINGIYRDRWGRIVKVEEWMMGLYDEYVRAEVIRDIGEDKGEHYHYYRPDELQRIEKVDLNEIKN
ncbi:MAG TPA: hypothetical protein PLQ98_00370 [Bacillota bacterium]|nr:hypothetical protein [Bacillota bacterium]